MNEDWRWLVPKETVENLKMIKELSEMICLNHDFKKIPHKRTQYDRCAAASCLYMDQSNENISNLEDSDSKVTCKSFIDL